MNKKKTVKKGEKKLSLFMLFYYNSVSGASRVGVPARVHVNRIVARQTVNPPPPSPSYARVHKRFEIKTRVFFRWKGKRALERGGG